MALQTLPAEWTDTAVMDYVISKWDHSLLKMAEFDTQVYINARKDFKCREVKSRPETVERSKQEYLQAKLTMLTKLVELRADRAKAQCCCCFLHVSRYLSLVI